MGRLRIERVQELIKQEIGNIILKDLKDPRIGFATVTRVKMTPDMRSARVFVSLMGDEAAAANSWNGLSSSLGYIQREVGRRVRLRFTPTLSLERDDSLDQGIHIQKILNEIRGGENTDENFNE